MKLKTAIRTMLGLLIAICLFHFSIVLKMVPYEITWGGRLKTDSEMYVFESISILINFFLITLLMIKGGYWKAFIPMKVVNVFLWIFVALFGLNTIGNLLAETTVEKFFTILTLASSILIWWILSVDKANSKTY